LELSLLAASTTLLLVMCVITCAGVYLLYRLVAFIDEFVEVDTSTPPEEKGEDEQQLSLQDLERMERDREFDERIRGLKEELAMQQDVKERKGTEAQILHPGIQNLPHDDVQTKYDVYPVEVAE